MKTIFSYYQSFPNSDQKEDFACANLWKGSWEKHGWNTVMLNKSHASSNRLYPKLMQKLIRSHLHDKECAKYIRWCALYAIGGGWMCDFDVANLGFSPQDADKIEQQGSLSIVKDENCYLFYATKDQAEEVVKTFSEKELKNGLVHKLESEMLPNAGDLKDILSDVFHAELGKELTRSKQIEQALNP